MADNDIIDDELDPCPSDEVLGLYLAGNLKPSWVERAIKSHVALCPSCKGRIKEMDRDEFIKRAAERLQRRVESLAAKREPVEGSVWRTVPETEDELYGPLVLVLEVEKDRLHVAEVSEDIGQALDSDMILDKPKSGLSFRCMVRSGNLFFMKAENLKGYGGTLPEELIQRVRDFCLRYDEFKDGIRLSQCRFGKDREGRSLMMREGIISGMPPASEDDARVKFLEEARERIAHLKKKILTPTEALDDVVHEERSSTRSASQAPVSLAEKRKPRRRYVLVGSIAAGLLAVVVTTAGVRQLLTQEEFREEKGIDSVPAAGGMYHRPALVYKEIPAPAASAAGNNVYQHKLMQHHTKGDKLQKAVGEGNVQGVRKLLDENRDLIDVPLPSRESASPLGFASEKGHYEVVKLLIERGAKIDAADGLEWTPLMSAAHSGHEDIVKLLLSKGADRSLKNVSGQTALDIAVAAKNKPVIDLLQAK